MMVEKDAVGWLSRASTAGYPEFRFTSATIRLAAANYRPARQHIECSF
jgi:hypothetical protein